VVVGIQRDGKMEFNPPPDAEMAPGDQLVVIGRPETLKHLELVAAGQAARPEG
jgi:K+/H+ antiporter YhaU regulatory subunit KhtT